MRKAAHKASKSTATYPKLELPIVPPFPPMEAKRVEEIPDGDQWIYEPKWDGFRALVFRDGDEVVMQSKAGQPLSRYFPELVEAFRALDADKFVIDGEITITVGGRLSFDDLLLRLHPAESRVKRLAEEIPAQFFAFDLLVEPARGGSKLITDLSLTKRREQLEKFFGKYGESDRLRISPSTDDKGVAEGWFRDFGAAGLDGVMAKLIDEPYHSGDRDGMVKYKNMKEADCVVAGIRYQEGTKQVAVLQLGLYDEDGLLQHVGNSSAFKASERKDVSEKVAPLVGKGGFSGDMMGGPSRWNQGKTSTSDPVPVEPKLVCEVRYDYFTQGRFRHGAKFLRWRPDKDPKSCTMDQVLPAVKGKAAKVEKLSGAKKK
jgi:ATP-dependent DNA ligase